MVRSRGIRHAVLCLTDLSAAKVARALDQYGAMASHLRVGNPLFSHLLFGVYLGLMMWGGLWLRDAGLRAIFPWRTRPST